FVGLLQEDFRVFVERSHLYASLLRVRKKVSRRGKVRIHGDYPLESLRQRQRKESNARVQIQRHGARSAAHDRLQQLFQQEPVHLEEREMTHPIAESPGLMEQVSRPAQIELVGLLVQQQKTVELRHRLAKGRRQLRRWLRELLKRDVKRDLVVTRV